MLILKQIPSVNHSQVELYYKSLPLLEKIKHVFSSKVLLPSSYQGVSLYEDVVLLDPANSLIMGQKHESIIAVYNAKEPDMNKMINHTVYTISGLTPYGILGDAKVCSVDRFDIQIDRCWKSSY